MAIQNVEEVKTTWSVRLLLIKGASRKLADKHDRYPIDVAKELKIPHIAKELVTILVNNKSLIILARLNFLSKTNDYNPIEESKKNFFLSFYIFGSIHNGHSLSFSYRHTL